MTSSWILAVIIFFLIGISFGLQFKVKRGMNELLEARKCQVDLTQRMLYELVSQKQMEEYFKKLDVKISEINKSAGKNEKERWSRIENAFGGNKGEQ